MLTSNTRPLIKRTKLLSCDYILRRGIKIIVVAHENHFRAHAVACSYIWGYGPTPAAARLDLLAVISGLVRTRGVCGSASARVDVAKFLAKHIQAGVE